MVALLLCIIFVLFLLWLDWAHAPKVSWVLWLPTIWMLCVSSKSLGAWFGVEQDVEGSPLDRIVLSGLFSFGFLVLIKRRFNWSTAIRNNPWLFVLLGYMLVSILWSDIPYTSLKRWSRELGAVIMAFVILSERDPRQAVQSVLKRTTYILIPFSLILVKYFPGYGVEFGRWDGERMWVGVSVQKNGLGRLCIVSIFVLVYTLIRERRLRGNRGGKGQTLVADVFVVLIALFLLKGPPGVYPATAFVALGVGLTAFFGLGWMKQRKIYLGPRVLKATIMFVVSFGTLIAVFGVSTVGDLPSALGRSETLTGRTEIWATLRPFVERRPILGYGFGGFWTQTTQDVVYGVNEAHSGYLNVTLGLGVVGLMLTAIFLLSVSMKAHRALVQDYDWARFCICYLLMVIVHNITESSIDSFGRQMMAVLLLVSMSFSKKNILSQRYGS